MITIIITNITEKKYLSRCIQSILYSGYKNVHILIQYNGSDQGIIDYSLEQSKHLNQISVVKENTDPINLAKLYGSTPYFCCCEEKDVFASNFFIKLEEVLEGEAVDYIAINYYKSDTGINFSLAHPKDGEKNFQDNLSKNILCFMRPALIGVVLKTDIIKNEDIYLKGETVSDTLFFLKAYMQYVDKAYVIGDPLLYCVLNPSFLGRGVSQQDSLKTLFYIGYQLKDQTVSSIYAYLSGCMLPYFKTLDVYNRSEDYGYFQKLFLLFKHREEVIYFIEKLFHIDYNAFCTITLPCYCNFVSADIYKEEDRALSDHTEGKVPYLGQEVYDDQTSIIYQFQIGKYGLKTIIRSFIGWIKFKLIR